MYLMYSTSEKLLTERISLETSRKAGQSRSRMTAHQINDAMCFMRTN